MHNNPTGSIAFCKINYFACIYLLPVLTSYILHQLSIIHCQQYMNYCHKNLKYIYAHLSAIRVLVQTNVLYVREINQQCLVHPCR